jgi:hypothetical protein
MSKPEGKISLGRTRGRVEGLRGTRWESFEWINLAEVREM